MIGGESRPKWYGFRLPPANESRASRSRPRERRISPGFQDIHKARADFRTPIKPIRFRGPTSGDRLRDTHTTDFRTPKNDGLQETISGHPQTDFSKAEDTHKDEDTHKADPDFDQKTDFGTPRPKNRFRDTHKQNRLRSEPISGHPQTEPTSEPISGHPQTEPTSEPISGHPQTDFRTPKKKPGLGRPGAKDPERRPDPRRRVAAIAPGGR
jgi:hypothetical protein